MSEFAGIWKVNEALGSWQRVQTELTAGEFQRQLRRSSVLSHTRRFVAWVQIDDNGAKVELERGEA